MTAPDVDALVLAVVADGVLLDAHLLISELGVLWGCLAFCTEVGKVNFLQGLVDKLPVSLLHR